MQNGLSHFKRHPNDLMRHYTVAPVWNFLIPATLGVQAWQMGCLAPSCDRVGRYYPVCVSLRAPLAAPAATLLDGAATWYWECGSGLLRAIRHSTAPDQLDADLLRAARAGFSPRATGSLSDILDVLGVPGDALTPAGPQQLGWPELPLCFNPSGYMSYWWTNQSDGSPMRMVAHSGGLNLPLFCKLFSHGRVA